MSDDPFDKLNEDKRPVGGGGDYAPWWNDENFGVSEGDTLVGIVVEKHDYTDPGGDAHPVATVRSVGRGHLDAGTEVSTPTRKGIENFAGNADIGDLVLIEYTGKVKANSGRDMHTYEASKMTFDEWSEMDQADDLMSVWQASEHYDGGVDIDSNGDSPDSVNSEAVDFAQDVVAMNEQVTREELDEYLNEIRDYAVDVAEIIEAAGLTEDDDGHITA